MGSQASSLMSCLFQGCYLAPEGGVPAHWTLHASRRGVVSSKQPPLVAHGTSSKARYCFYPRERLTAEPANSIGLVRCKMSYRPFLHQQAEVQRQLSLRLQPLRLPAWVGYPAACGGLKPSSVIPASIASRYGATLSPGRHLSRQSANRAA